jgi:peptidoglycan/xylan/chitin deacetylase (PgdA/CDA1 family)
MHHAARNGGTGKKMRFVLFVVCCALGVSVASLAQSVSPDQSTSAPSAATPVSAEPSAVTPTEPATTGSLEQSSPQEAAKPIEQPASTESLEQANPQEAAEPAEQSVVQATDQQAAKLADDTSEPAAEQHAALPADTSENPDAVAPAPVAEPNQQAAEQPAEQPAAETVAKAAEQHAAIPAETSENPDSAATAPIAEPAERPAEQPAAETVAKADEQGCPGHPNALGTSRVLTIAPDQFKLLGTIQYKQTLPLKDHEVVLTFDDGPIPPYTNSILDTLASQCVKATYFLVGEMARARPYLVRRIYNEGHSIGTHTQHHPFAMQRLSMQRVESEVDGGIASVDAALGDPKAVSPFFRIPGLGRTNAIESFLEHKGLVTWSADVDTNDWWRGSTPRAIVQRTMRRLNEKGRGIILMHDIHPATALALPALLNELKAGGYHVVHVIAVGEHPKSLPEVVASPVETENWPRVLRATTEKQDADATTLRRRVKAVLGKRRHQRAAKHKGSLTTSAVERRHTPY